MKKSMREIYLETVAKYPKLDLSGIKNIGDLEKKGEGIFIIDDLPSVDLIKEFPKIFNSNGEVSLFCIENIWFITLSKNGFAYVPALLDGYIRNGVCKCFFHLQGKCLKRTIKTNKGGGGASTTTKNLIDSGFFITTKTTFLYIRKLVP